MRKFSASLVRCLLLAGLLLPWGPPAQAGPASIYTVVSTLDNPDAAPGNDVCADSVGSCTLRAAVMEANAHVGPDTILLPADTFQLTRAGAEENAANTGDLDLQGVVTLQGMGAGASVVDAVGLNDRVFDVLTSTTASLSQITIRGGLVPNLVNHAGGGVRNWGTLTLTEVLITKNNLTDPQRLNGGGIANHSLGVLALTNSQVISNAAEFGGGIFNLGQMTITGSQVLSNTGDYGAGVWNQGGLALSASQVLSNTAYEGGGIFNVAALAVNNSTLGGNAAVYGGGLANSSGAEGVTISGSAIHDNLSDVDGGGLFSDSGVITVTNSTFSGNSAGVSGGGLFLNAGVLDGYNLTIADNLANAGLGGGTGGGFYRFSGTVTLRNTLLASNGRASIGGDIADDCKGDFGAFHHTLVQVTTGCTFSPDNTLVGQNPLLLPLAANGGPTLTQALGPGSPALDKADPAGCESPFGGFLLTDQRGRPREVDGNDDGLVRCDIGAYEAQWLLFLPLMQR